MIPASDACLGSLAPLNLTAFRDARDDMGFHGNQWSNLGARHKTSFPKVWKPHNLWRNINQKRKT